MPAVSQQDKAGPGYSLSDVGGTIYRDKIIISIILFAGQGMREQPSPESLQLLDGVNTLRTDERGDIEVIVDGEKMEVNTQK